MFKILEAARLCNFVTFLWMAFLKVEVWVGSPDSGILEEVTVSQWVSNCFQILEMAIAYIFRACLFVSTKFRYLSLSKCEIETVGKRFGRHAVWIQHQTVPVPVDIHLIITSTLNNEHLFAI